MDWGAEMDDLALKLSVEYEGQPFVDDPVCAMPKPATKMESSLALAFKRRLPQPIHTGYERVRLRWMKRGSDGKLVPR